MSRNTRFILIILGLLPLAILIYGYLNFAELYGSQVMVRSSLAQYGVWAAAVFIALQAFQVVVTPINHYIIGLAGGFIFGPLWGAVYNWIGRVIGTFVAFCLARQFGRPLVERLVKKETLDKYDKVWEKGVVSLFFMYFLPIFPDDELSYIVGVSKMPSRVFIPTMTLGHIGGSIGLAYVGSGMGFKDPTLIAILVINIMAFFVYLFIQRRKN